MPVVLAIVGNIRRIVPSAEHFVLVSAAAFVVGLVLRRRGVRPVIDLGASQDGKRDGLVVESLIVGGFIVLFSALVNLPRLDMLIHDDQATAFFSSHEQLYLAHLVSVARLGGTPCLQR
jgi:hypothetical protein